MQLNCRSCGRPLRERNVFADLGSAPLANALLTQDSLDQPVIHYPLRALVCEHCFLVQLPVSPDAQTLFTADYPFRSGLSGSWLAHCKEFADKAIERFYLSSHSHVLELGSNDGVGLLRFRHHGIPTLGVEPCEPAATIANCEYGIATVVNFWSSLYAEQLSSTGYHTDLVLCRNVLAHVPDLNDFLQGIRRIMKPNSTLVVEVPYIANLMEYARWDQIYHEHHCYFSLASLTTAAHRNSLYAYDVEEIPTHGGSLRVYFNGKQLPVSPAYTDLMEQEVQKGLNEIGTYRWFAGKPHIDKERILGALIDQVRMGRTIVGYGASAKAATLLNYCGIGSGWIQAVIDITPSKWGKYLPGSRIPIKAPPYLDDHKPDVILNFCWNWREESEQRIRTACPEATILYLNE